MAEGRGGGSSQSDEPEDEPPGPVFCRSPHEVRANLPLEMDVEAIPFATGLGRRSVYDLKHSLNEYGREIFIESENPNGKPTIWYQFDKKGNKVRYERRPFGINTERLNASPYL